MVAPRVFVSHSHQDNAYCRSFVAALCGAGVDTWYDEHNLGWGALRHVIERELQAREHFVAILSPASVASDWVNAEIDAALDLLRDGHLKTIAFVLAAPCAIPLLLRRYKRVEVPGGLPVSAEEAATRVARLIASAEAGPQMASERDPDLLPALAIPAFPIPPDGFTVRLGNLGFSVHRAGDIEYVRPPVCEIPAGPFLMGSDPKRDHLAYDDELPQHSVTLPTYTIGRFPVTVAEYACFVRGGRPALQDWPGQLTQLDHPVVNVSWHDALAYAAWLARLTGQPWRLPTEAEWEKAARGSDERLYPWGDEFRKDLCNTSEGRVGSTVPIGSHPAGASPWGAQDLAGNVWEWTSTLFKPYPYDASDGRERAGSIENHVLRGGAWSAYARYVRAAYRNRRPYNVNANVGFRLVCAVPDS